MIHFRNAQYCNLKLFLIFLVIYGHLIEPRILHMDALMTQYQWIYMFHMPLFCFMSGLFLHNAKGCKKQLMKYFPLYILLQMTAVICNKDVNPLVPYWHLWYLLSYCTWLLFAWLWLRFGKGRGKLTVFICSVALGSIAGLIPFIGYKFSLSRTLVFFPYFWLGLICDPNFPWKKFRHVGMIAFIISTLLILCGKEQISVKLLYHATPYDDANGMLFRIGSYFIGAGLSLFFLSFTPTNRYCFTKFGTSTTFAYIIHAPIVLLLRKWDISWPFYIIISIGILYISHIIVRWHGNLYSIIPNEKEG